METKILFYEGPRKIEKQPQNVDLSLSIEKFKRQLLQIVFSSELNSYIINLLLQLDLGFTQGVDFVLLCLQVFQCLLVSLLQGQLLLGQLGDGIIERGHLLSQVFYL